MSLETFWHVYVRLGAQFSLPHHYEIPSHFLTRSLFVTTNFTTVLIWALIQKCNGKNANQKLFIANWNTWLLKACQIFKAGNLDLCHLRILYWWVYLYYFLYWLLFIWEFSWFVTELKLIWKFMSKIWMTSHFIQHELECWMIL